MSVKGANERARDKRGGCVELRSVQALGEGEGEGHALCCAFSVGHHIGRQLHAHYCGATVLIALGR